MITLWLLALLSVAALVVTVRSVFHDGPVRPPRSHAQDPTFRPPSERATYDVAA